jgi:uncharacterized protein YkwD
LQRFRDARIPPVRATALTRIVAVAAASFVAVLLAAPVFAREQPPPTLRASAPSLAESVRARINAIRHDHGLRPLATAPALARSARAHARAMASRGFFGHDSRDGASASDRIRRYYPGSLIGETLLWRSPGLSAQQVVALWLGSPPHRRVLLNAAFRDIGIGVVRAAAAPGAFGGLDVTIVVADFGAP